MVTETTQFLETNKGVLRTLHLNSRLYPEILPSSQLSERSSEYQRMAFLLQQHKSEICVIKTPKPVVTWLFSF